MSKSIQIKYTADKIHEMHEAINTIVLFTHTYESIIDVKDPSFDNKEFKQFYSSYMGAIKTIKTEVSRINSMVST